MKKNINKNINKINYIWLFMIPIFMFIYNIYLHRNYIGTIISLISLILVNTLYCINRYGFGTLMKMYLIIFLTLIIFLCKDKVVFKHFFKFTQFLIQLNILILIFTTNNLPLIALLLITTVTVPNFNIKDSIITMENSLIKVDYWLILFTITLFIYYTTNIYFKENYIIILFALFAPLIYNYLNIGTWIESRALFLNLLIIFDLFMTYYNIPNLNI